MGQPLAHSFRARQLSRQNRQRASNECPHTEVHFAEGNQWVVCHRCQRRAKASWVLEIQENRLHGYAVRYSFGMGWRTIWAEIAMPCDPDWGEFVCIPLRPDCESLLEQARRSTDESLAGTLLQSWRSLVWYGSPPTLY